MTALVLFGFGFAVHTKPGAVLAIFVFGITGSLLVPMLQTRLMDVARDGQSLAAALNHSTLNLANALGRLDRRPGARPRPGLRVAEPGRRRCWRWPGWPIALRLRAGWTHGARPIRQQPATELARRPGARPRLRR